jgi:hypothetical protein
MHYSTMRTTITIDEDAHEFAKIYARANGITLGDAIGELIRKAQAAQAQTPVPAIRRLENGFPVFSSSGMTITPELVKRLEEEEFEP